jgi:protein-tyrosine phosphatase
MVKVLFVCTGNICRSPTAEGVFRQIVRAAGLERSIGMDSAGTQGAHVGEPPDRRSQRAARARGIDLSDLRARRVRAADFHDFDLLLAMDLGHLAQLRQMAPEGTGDKVRLFLDFAPEAPRREVPDPYYGEGDSHFIMVLDLCEMAAGGLLAHIRQSMPPQP